MVDDGLSRADRVLLLDRDHQVAEAGTPAELAHAPALRRLYGPVPARDATVMPPPEPKP
jgi:hypothetical protein